MVNDEGAVWVPVMTAFNRSEGHKQERICKNCLLVHHFSAQNTTFPFVPVLITLEQRPTVCPPKSFSNLHVIVHSCEIMWYHLIILNDQEITATLLYESCSKVSQSLSRQVVASLSYGTSTMSQAWAWRQWALATNICNLNFLNAGHNCTNSWSTLNSFKLHSSRQNMGRRVFFLVCTRNETSRFC